MRTFFLYFFFKIFWNFILTIVIGVRFMGNRNLKSLDQFIIASNHNSHLDSIVLMSALPTNKLKNTHPIAAKDYFGSNRISAFFTWFFINAELINRRNAEDGSQVNPIRRMIELLNKKKSLILFPEGSRGIPGEMSEFKNGIGYVVENKPGIPVIPVYMEGLGRVLPKGVKIILPNITKIYFGKPIYFKNESAKEITSTIESAILSLKNKSIVNLDKNIK